LIPSVALNEFNQMFLDETPFQAIENELGLETVLIDPTARALADFIESLA